MRHHTGNTTSANARKAAAAAERIVLTTIVSTIAQRGESTWIFDARGDEQLDGEQQPLKKPYRVDTERESIDLYWIESPRLLCVRNMAGLGLKANPTPEEAAFYRSQILWLGPSPEFPDAIFVPPLGGVAYFRPNPDHHWVWQSSVGEIPVELFAVA